MTATAIPDALFTDVPPPAPGGAAAHQPYAHQTRRLLNCVLTGVPRRIAVMRETGDRKYQDLSGVDRDTFLTLANDHLAGKRTIAATLADASGMARAGCRDYDAGGEAALLAALASDAARGITSFAILTPGDPHPGGHVWRFYDRPCPAADIRADLRRLPGAPGEVYPSGNVIRLPFGFHRRKRTRGVLILQDGRRYNLDDPLELRAGIAAALALPRNPPPPPAPAGADHARSGAWGEHHQPDAWARLPDGAALWNSSRIHAVARHRAQLATLLRGDRVTLMRDGAPDDSDSAQVASLVYNLMGANFPEDEVRAIADFLHARLRPDKSRDHYRAHVDAEIARYRPRDYRPEPTRHAAAPATGGHGETPAPLPPAQHVKPKPARGRPAAQPGGPGGYLAWLIEQAGPGGMLLMSQAECARACGVSLATVKRYERALKAAGLIERDPFNRRQAGRVIIRVERGVKNHADAVSSPAGDVVSANCAAPHTDAENQNAGAHYELTHAARDPDCTHARACDAHADAQPEGAAAPVEDVRLASAIAPLPAVISRALDLLGDVSRSKRKRLARAMVEAERGEIDDRAFERAYRAALDVRRLLTLDKKRLHREAKKRARFAARVQRDAMTGRASDAQAFAALFAARRAARVLERVAGAAVDDGPDGRMRPFERRTLADLRERALDARDARARREYYAGRLRDALPVRDVAPGAGVIRRAQTAEEREAAWRELEAINAALRRGAPAPAPGAGVGAGAGGAARGCVLSTPPAASDAAAQWRALRALQSALVETLPADARALLDIGESLYPAPLRLRVRRRDRALDAPDGVLDVPVVEAGDVQTVLARMAAYWRDVFPDAVG